MKTAPKKPPQACANATCSAIFMRRAKGPIVVLCPACRKKLAQQRSNVYKRAYAALKHAQGKCVCGANFDTRSKSLCRACLDRGAAYARKSRKSSPKRRPLCCECWEVGHSSLYCPSTF